MRVASLATERCGVKHYAATVYALTRIREIGDDLPEMPTVGEKLLQFIGDVGLWHNGKPNQSAFARRLGLPVSRINAHIKDRHAFAKPDTILRYVDTLNQIAREKNLPRTFSEADFTVGVSTPNQRPKGNGKAHRQNPLNKNRDIPDKVVAPNALTGDTAFSFFGKYQGAHGAETNAAAGDSFDLDQAGPYEPPADQVAYGLGLLRQSHALNLLSLELARLGSALARGQVAISVIERPGGNSSVSSSGGRLHGGPPRKSA